MGETGLRGTDSDAWFFRLQRKEEEQVFGERAWRRLEVSVDPRAARNGVGGGEMLLSGQVMVTAADRTGFRWGRR